MTSAPAIDFTLYEYFVLDVPGNVSAHGMVLGDADNDGENELIVGTLTGELHVFKNNTKLCSASGLGSVCFIASCYFFLLFKFFCFFMFLNK